MYTELGIVSLWPIVSGRYGIFVLVAQITVVIIQQCDDCTNRACTR